MTNINTYKKNKLNNALAEHEKKRKELESKEMQLGLYEQNTGKIDAKAHMQLAEEYKENTEKLKKAAGIKERIKITADMLDF